MCRIVRRSLVAAIGTLRWPREGRHWLCIGSQGSRGVSIACFCMRYNRTKPWRLILKHTVHVMRWYGKTHQYNAFCRKCAVNYTHKDDICSAEWREECIAKLYVTVPSWTGPKTKALSGPPNARRMRFGGPNLITSPNLVGVWVALVHYVIRSTVHIFGFDFNSGLRGFVSNMIRDLYQSSFDTC